MIPSGRTAPVYEVGNQAPFRHLIVFFTESRTIHARDQAFCFRVLACSSSAFFLPRRSPLTRGWGRAAGEQECCSFLRMSSTRRSLLPSCRLASLRPKRYARTTVYPCDAGEGAITRYLVRALRTGRHIESSPIERTVPLQVTRRQNGDFLRLASLLRPRRFRPPSLAYASGSFAYLSNCRGCLLRVSASRRIHVQSPIFLLGPLGQLPLILQSPQRNP